MCQGASEDTTAALLNMLGCVWVIVSTLALGHCTELLALFSLIYLS